MYYEIIVSKDGKHYFSVNDRKFNDSNKAKELYIDLRRRFPAREGFEITAIYHPESSYDYTVAFEVGYRSQEAALG